MVEESLCINMIFVLQWPNTIRSDTVPQKNKQKTLALFVNKPQTQSTLEFHVYVAAQAIQTLLHLETDKYDLKKSV